MHVRDVVPLQVVVYVHLPVRVHVVIDPTGEPELADAGGRDALPDTFQVGLERLGTLRQAHEHEAFPFREVHGGEAVVPLVEQLHAIEVRHPPQHPIEPIGPPVVLADQHVGVAVLHRQRAAAVAADVEEGAQRAILPAYYDDRLPRDVGDRVVAGPRQLVRVGHVLP